MTSALSIVFFIVFAIILVWMYLSIRRGWGAPGFVAGAGIIGSIISMLLMSISQGNVALHAIVVGLLVGGIFSGVTLAVAWYFRVKEFRTSQASTTNYE
jgi:Na+/H+-translocating membrane pyrophosphatase